MRYLYCFLILHFSFTIKSQNNSSEKVIFYKKISDLLQAGIDKALNNNIIESYTYFDEAYKQAIAGKHDELVPVIVLAQSRLYLIEEKYDAAFTCVKKAEKLIEQNPKTSLSGDYYEFLGQCYTHQKNYDLALENLKKCEDIRKDIEPGKNWRTYTGMARIYKLIKNNDLHEKYNEQSNKLSKIQNSKRIILDMQNDLQFDEQNGTIAYLNHENLKSKVALQKSKFRNILLMICLVSFIIITGFLYYILHQRSKHHKEIAAKNEIISKSLIEKESLLKEIHHRVKNNLQVISSLLSLQSRSIDDKNASEALNQTQSRVISMSLIHETLYKDGPSSVIDLQVYLTNLCRQIFNTYNIDGDKIKLHLDVCSLLVDVGNLVPIGLIVNELITNALKYAFVGKEEGNIWIKSNHENNTLFIAIKDDGIGSENTVGNEKGFGNKLIDTFAKKLNATIQRKYDRGTEVCLSLSNI